MNYDPKTDSSVRNACVMLGVYIHTLPSDYDPLHVASVVERTAMEIAERAVREALKTHNICAQVAAIAAATYRPEKDL